MSLALDPWVNVIDNHEDGPGVRQHGYAYREVWLIAETLLLFSPDLIVEWGTNVGNSARVFWETADAIDLDCEIHSVEISDNVHGGRGVMVEGLDVELHVGEGLATALALNESIKPERPLFFLDDSHVYVDVLDQLETIADRIPHAVMLVHDVFTVDLFGKLMLHEPGVAVRDFSARDRYDIVSVTAGGAMMRLWPK